uniref:Uncharacterized protein n=1 Tax=Rhizoctonia solani TaxID=456999 RepID=N0ACR3_9AGAM|nr:hypothetical protein RSOL_m00370 [Rhizoctonia solani]AGK45372.1 hypothetical protein RSOL_m00370 [Rhizoctonia solani]
MFWGRNCGSVLNRCKNKIHKDIVQIIYSTSSQHMGWVFPRYWVLKSCRTFSTDLNKFVLICLEEGAS